MSQCNFCQNEATHTATVYGVECDICMKCVERLKEKQEQQAEQRRRRNFWKKVAITPFYPFIWCE